jgi:hypothetical protein
LQSVRSIDGIARDVAEFLATLPAPRSGGAQEHADQDRGDAAPLQQHYPLAQHERREGERDKRVGAGVRPRTAAS